MIEDIQNQKHPPRQGIEGRAGKRFKALSDGYVGLIYYHRWKNSLLNPTASQPLDGEPKSGWGGRCLSSCEKREETEPEFTVHRKG